MNSPVQEKDYCRLRIPRCKNSKVLHTRQRRKQAGTGTPNRCPGKAHHTSLDQNISNLAVYFQCLERRVLLLKKFHCPSRWETQSRHRRRWFLKHVCRARLHPDNFRMHYQRLSSLKGCMFCSSVRTKHMARSCKEILHESQHKGQYSCWNHKSNSFSC